MLPVYVRAFVVVATLIVLASTILPVLADCIATPNGSGSDYHCTDTTTLVTGSPGSDTIINDGFITTYMWGGGFSFNADQQDTLINNSVVGSATTDDGMWGGGGNDTIINNGTVNGGPWTIWAGLPGAIFGDSTEGIADHDTIINNGTSNGNIHGDYSGGGDDTIIVNGQVNGGVYGEGHESVQFNRYGNDTVVLQNNAVITTIIDGMGGNDTLRFEFSIPDQATYETISDLIYYGDPAGDSLTFNGHTYTWVNFEFLVNDMVWTGGPTPTHTPTPTFTPTYTPTNTPTATYTPSNTPTATYTPTHTPTYTPTNTPTATLTPSATFTPSATLTTPTSPPNAPPERQFSDQYPFVLTWSAVTWAQGYVIQIALDVNFTSPVVNTEVPASTQSFNLPVLGNGVYYWRVGAKRDASTPVNWGAADTFYISAPATPTPG